MSKVRKLIFFIFLLCFLSLASASENPYENVSIDESLAVSVTNITQVNLTEPDELGHQDFVSISGGNHTSNFGRLSFSTDPYVFYNGSYMSDLGNYLAKSSNQLLQSDNSGDLRVKTSFYNSLIKEHFFISHPVTELGYNYSINLKDWTTKEYNPQNNTSYLVTSYGKDSTTDVVLDSWGNAIVRINGADTVVMPQPTAVDSAGNEYTLSWELQQNTLQIGSLDKLQNAVYPVVVDPTELVTNGGFETGNTSGWTVTGSATVYTGGHSGTYYCRCSTSSSSPYTSQITQSINLYQAQPLTFYYRLGGGSGQPGAQIYSLINTTSIWSTDSYTSGVNWANVGSISLSSYNGSSVYRNVGFRGYIGTNPYSGMADFDDISIKGPGSSPQSQPVSFTQTSTWTCPANVTSVKYMLIGPGGAGGAGGYGSSYISYLGIVPIDGFPVPLIGSVYLWGGGGGGGGRGEKNEGTTNVIPGQTYNLTLSLSGTYFDVLASSTKGGDGSQGGDAITWGFGGDGGDKGTGGIGYGVNGGNGQPNGGSGVGAPGYNINSSIYGGGGAGGRGGYGYPDVYDAKIIPIIGIVDANYNRIPGSVGHLGFIQIIPIYNSSGGSGGYSPIADFVSNVTSGYAPLTVAFTDQSTASPTSWSWTFGDGNTSTSQNPTHTYSSPGTYTVSLTATNAQGSNTTTKSGYITVTSANAPIADFSNSPSSGRSPLTVQFSDRSTHSPTSWSWNFGDGNTSNAQNPSHTYYSSGSYTISLTATNSYGSDIKSKNNAVSVSSSTAPIAAFSGSPTSGHAPLTVNFKDKSLNSPTSWSWDFGDGSTSTSQNPSHTYSNAGNYSVQLIATNAAGSDLAVLTNYISVSANNAPVADFSATPRTGSAPLTVQFQDMSTGSPTSWYWQFGDGNWSNDRNPSHVYSTPGIYRIDFIATNAAGSSYIERDGYISVSSSGPSGSAPVADFSATPRTGSAPLTVQFQDMSTGSPTSWYWQFGDGNWSNQRNPSHVYSSPGNYRVDFIATNAAGSSYIERNNYISVSSSGPSGSAPTADFSATPRTGTSPLTVQFQDMSTGSPTSWYWQFGDGNWSNDRNPSHVYSTPGTYRVDFIATNSYGSSYLERDNYISVSSTGVSGSAPVADFSATPRTGAAPLTVQFQDISTGSPTSWYWQFGDGNWSNDRNPSHIYSSPGNYRVDFIATNSNGSSYLERDNYISVSSSGPSGNAPVADFSASPRTGISPLTVQFQDTSTGSPTSWYWQFGDGNWSNDRNPSHVYSSPGTYRVDFIATNSHGSSYLEKDDYISVSGPGAPTADFSGTPRSGSTPLNVQFQDISTGSPTSWYWQFGDGNWSNERNPGHIYYSPGNYRVDFIATNSAGSSYIEKDNYISVSNPIAPVADFSGSPTSGSAPLQVSFTDQSTGSPTSWSWDFGDGSTSTQKNPTHSYSSAGSYTVQLTVANGLGSNSKTRSNYISVSSVSMPYADFSGSPTSGSAPLQVQFTDLSISSPTAWSWSFGDGSHSNERNPTHSYSAAGSYTVQLTSTIAGTPYTETKSNYITVGGATPTPTTPSNPNNPYPAGTDPSPIHQGARDIVADLGGYRSLPVIVGFLLILKILSLAGGK